MDSSVVQHSANVLDFVSGRAAKLEGQVSDLNATMRGVVAPLRPRLFHRPFAPLRPVRPRCRFAGAPSRPIRGPRADRVSGDRLAVRLHRQVRFCVRSRRCERRRAVRETTRLPRARPQGRAHLGADGANVARELDGIGTCIAEKQYDEPCVGRTASFLSHRSVLFRRTRRIRPDRSAVSTHPASTQTTRPGSRTRWRCVNLGRA